MNIQILSVSVYENVFKPNMKEAYTFFFFFECLTQHFQTRDRNTARQQHLDLVLRALTTNKANH